MHRRTTPTGFALSHLGALFLSLSMASAAQAYPGGTPDFQTDVGPYCAACHSSTAPEDLAGLGARAEAEMPAGQHFAAIKAGTGQYAELSVEDRGRLIELLTAVDQNSTIQIEGPAQVAPGAKFQVTVKVTGGAGPSVGVGLVDRAHRFYARPASSLGWEVVGAPSIIGPKGPQSEWIGRRPERAGRGITFVNVEGIGSSAEANHWSRAKIIYTLRAPQTPGDYPLVGAYFYGTETGAAMSTRIHPQHGAQPLGGALGKSGRIKFSKERMISVRAPDAPEAGTQPVAGVAPKP